MDKTYLGDGVYVEVESGMLKLTTEDGVKVSNVIYLNAELYHFLISWVKSLECPLDW